MLSLLETAPPAPNSSVPRNPLEPFNVTLLPGDSPSKTLQTTMSLPRNFNSARDPEGPTPRGNAETEEDTDSGVTKVRIDRKREFEKRRQSIQNRRKKVHLNQRACQSVERASPSKAAPSASRQSLPNFDLGGVTSSPKAAAVGSNTISQFFPLKNGASTTGVAGGGRVLSTAGGDQVLTFVISSFIPIIYIPDQPISEQPFLEWLSVPLTLTQAYFLPIFKKLKATSKKTQSHFF